MPDSIIRQRVLERDLEVQTILQELMAKYGYIDIPLIGDSQIDGKSVSISGILLHTPDSVRIEFWIPLLKNEIRRGSCSPYTLGQ